MGGLMDWFSAEEKDRLFMTQQYSSKTQSFPMMTKYQVCLLLYQTYLLDVVDTGVLDKCKTNEFQGFLATTFQKDDPDQRVINAKSDKIFSRAVKDNFGFKRPMEEKKQDQQR